jgi:hypothetical protein
MEHVDVTIDCPTHSKNKCTHLEYPIDAILDEIKTNITRMISYWSSKISPATKEQLDILLKKHTTCLSLIPVGCGTNVNESIHKKMNAFFHGIRLMSLEVVLARLTIFFYDHNRTKQGGTEETWKTTIHMEHSSPFTSYEQLDGVQSCTTAALLSSTITDSIEPPLPATVKSYHDVLNKVKYNIMSRSILYNPLEVLIHCSFRGFSFPPNLEPHVNDCDTEMLNDLSLESVDRKTNIFEVIMKQALYVSSRENNGKFKEFLVQSFLDKPNPCEALKEAILQEMHVSSDLYSNYFPSHTRFNDTLLSKELDLCSSAVINTICAAISVILKSVVIFVFPRCTEKFHVSLPVLNSDPHRLINNLPLFVMLRYTDCDLTFYCTTYKTFATVPPQINEDESSCDNDIMPSDKKCTCGKGRKSSAASCISNRCPCANSGFSCGPNCNCQLCENVNGRRCETTEKIRTCRCGVNNHSLDKSFCISSQCYCRKYGFSCNIDPVCACKQCANVLGASTADKALEEPPKKRQVTERLMLLQKSSGKLPDISSKVFFKKTGQKVIQSIWSDEESLLMKSLMRYLQTTERHVPVKMLTNMFNTYTDSLLHIRTKTPHQVFFKMRHCYSIKNICNS